MKGSDYVGNIKFQILINHTEEAALYVKDQLKKAKVKICDLREADIINTEDKNKIGLVYIFCCEGNVFKFLKMKQKYRDQITYEGITTLM